MKEASKKEVLMPDEGYDVMLKSYLKPDGDG